MCPVEKVKCVRVSGRVIVCLATLSLDVRINFAARASVPNDSLHNVCTGNGVCGIINKQFRAADSRLKESRWIFQHVCMNRWMVECVEQTQEMGEREREGMSLWVWIGWYYTSWVCLLSLYRNPTVNCDNDDDDDNDCGWQSTYGCSSHTEHQKQFLIATFDFRCIQFVLYLQLLPLSVAIQTCLLFDARHSNACHTCNRRVLASIRSLSLFLPLTPARSLSLSISLSSLLKPEFLFSFHLSTCCQYALKPHSTACISSVYG